LIFYGVRDDVLILHRVIYRTMDLSPDPASVAGNDLLDVSTGTLSLSGVTYIRINPYLTTLGTGA
jgi:hypothetical protein